MVRIVLGVIAGFFAWAVVWVGSEKILSAISPEWFGAHQLAFQAAIEHGPDASGFTADTTILLMHIVLASIASVMSGFLAALIAGENKRTPLILGFLLLAVGLLKWLCPGRMFPFGITFVYKEHRKPLKRLKHS